MAFIIKVYTLHEKQLQLYNNWNNPVGNYVNPIHGFHIAPVAKFRCTASLGEAWAAGRRCRARGGHSNVKGGIRLVQKFTLIGLFFRTGLYVGTSFRGTKRAKLEKRCVFGHIDKVWKEHDRQIKKNAYKNGYLGSFLIPENMWLGCFLWVHGWAWYPLLPFQWPTRAPGVGFWGQNLGIKYIPCVGTHLWITMAAKSALSYCQIYWCEKN